MLEKELIHASPIRPLDWLRAIPFEPAAWSDRLGWAKRRLYSSTRSFRRSETHESE
jgi:hypothetical protein